VTYEYQMTGTGPVMKDQTRTNEVITPVVYPQPITITPPNRINQPPLPLDDSLTIEANTSSTIDVVANDIDPDGDLNENSLRLTQQPTHGSVALAGAGTVIYTPDRDYSGTDRFVYEICDTDDACEIATVFLTVRGNNDAVASGPARPTQDPLPEPNPQPETPPVQPAGTEPEEHTDSTLPNQTQTPPATQNGITAPEPSAQPAPPSSLPKDEQEYLTSEPRQPVINPALTQLPVARNDVYVVTTNAPMNLPVTSNDQLDPSSVYEVTITRQPGTGTLRGVTDNEGEFRPASMQIGRTDAQYQICDALTGACSQAIISLTVEPDFPTLTLSSPPPITPGATPVGPLPRTGLEMNTATTATLVGLSIVTIAGSAIMFYIHRKRRMSGLTPRST